ncbi:hypothetical protein Baya_4203 [Bagarius yarrelli]|uniref:Uncharacterized protein n=1 Tax=Bagarius yarrelli TaxID=175774 RepID=A0A556TVP0_BAGYA|nr:hypothetical protein Baya_4203 [Bagarius yarrelli]
MGSDEETRSGPLEARPGELALSFRHRIVSPPPRAAFRPSFSPPPHAAFALLTIDRHSVKYVPVAGARWTRLRRRQRWRLTSGRVDPDGAGEGGSGVTGDDIEFGGGGGYYAHGFDLIDWLPFTPAST